MRRICVILLSVIAITVSACSKHNQQTEAGNINGVPAITLYGTTGEESDYLFIVLTDTVADKRIFYAGSAATYTYSGISSTNNIYIIAPGTNIIKCTIDTLSAHVSLTINTTPSLFQSTVYTAK